MRFLNIERRMTAAEDGRKGSVRGFDHSFPVVLLQDCLIFITEHIAQRCGVGLP
ncbi:MAG: hypothetical protein RMN51_01070 [Verrucomicrobiota bacterium]|nr:hypothetical protein [Verrucomicrobiota bacterium]